MTDEIGEKDFLSRWSARKLAEETTDEDVAGLAIPKATDAPPVDLPDIETLEADSDFTAFLGDTVPKDLAKLAFRKLWRSDPVLANIDGLNDYDEDFSMVGKAVEVIKSAYQVGKGYATEEEEEREDEGENNNLSDASDVESEPELEPEPEDAITAEQDELAVEDVGEVDTVPQEHPAKL